MDEWETVRAALTVRGVRGPHDLGRFVSNVDAFRPSDFDELAAMPVLIEVLPKLTDPKLISAIAGHLRRPWARPQAFEPLYGAFLRIAPVDEVTGWKIGDALANAARIQELPLLLEIASNPAYGMARQMVVHALSRFKRSSDVKPALIPLLTDPQVALHAMSALRTSIGARDALPYLQDIEARYYREPLGHIATREIRKAEKSIQKPMP